MGQQFAPIDTSTNTEYLVKKNEIEGLVDVLFQQRTQAIATFLSTKLYRFFVYSDPASVDQTVVAAMATRFIQNNWEIKPSMVAGHRGATEVRALLRQRNSWCVDQRGRWQVARRIYNWDGAAKARAYAGRWPQRVATYRVDVNMTAIGQQIFQPPNVSASAHASDGPVITTGSRRTRIPSAEPRPTL